MTRLLARLREWNRGGFRPLRSGAALAAGVGLVWLLLAAGGMPGPDPLPREVGDQNLVASAAPKPEGADARLLPGPVAPPPRHPFPVLTLEDAWRRLPGTETGRGGPLPVWARVLAGFLPRTTAVMLELDYLHRERNPLPPALRGKLRWVAANVNHCRYSETLALADLRRAGVDETGIRALVASQESFPVRERVALQFARKLTLAASTVTDSEIANLLDQYGEEQVVAMVLLLAHANFQDRLLLALDIQQEEGEVRPPLAVRFREEGPAPKREIVTPRLVDRPEKAPRLKQADGPERLVLDLSQLKGGLKAQRSRRSRIPLPSVGPGQINWGLVCRTYQPELAAAWGRCGHAYDLETDQDPILNQSVFWVVTHTVGCFY